MRRSKSPQGKRYRIAGSILLGAGMLLLVASGAYYAYGAVAKSRLDQLTYSAERPSTPSPDHASVPADGEAAAATGESPPSQGDGDTNTGALAQETSIHEASRASPQPDGGISGPIAAGATAAEAEIGETQVSAQSRDREAQVESEAVTPRISSVRTGKIGIGEMWGPAKKTAGADAGGESAQFFDQGTTATVDDASAAQVSDDITSDSTSPDAPTLAQADGTDADNLEGPAEELPLSLVESLTAQAHTQPASISTDLIADPSSATRISIPAISVDSKVKELEVVRLEDSYAWETPNRVVGHIPTTAKPGDEGQGWYFGHLESPIKGEGNVFLLLPEIPRLLQEGQTVHIYLETDNLQYVYQVYKTEVLRREELRLTDTGERDITLVVCVPRFVYDHRLLVTAALVSVS